MHDMNNGFGLPSPQERLASLRSPQSTPTRSHPAQRAVRMEILVGLVVIVVGVAVALNVLAGRDAVVQQTQPQVSAQSDISVPDPGGLLDGEGLMALALEAGDFPPELVSGDIVRAVLTPGSDGQGGFREIGESLTVTSVERTDEPSGKTVITVRGRSETAVDLASSGPIHLTIIERAGVK